MRRWPMFVLMLGLSSCSWLADLLIGDAPSEPLPPLETAQLIEWTEFGVTIDTRLVLDIDEYDWPPLPLDTGRYLGTVVGGRQTAADLVQWQIILDPPAEMPDGSVVEEVWIGARHVGRELDLLLDPTFDDTIFVVTQGGGAWMTEVWRADQDVEPIPGEPWEALDE